MKAFIKIVLGNLVALILFGFVAVVFFGAMITALLRTEGPPRIEEGSVLVFDMSANLTDAPPATDFWQAIEEAVGPETPPVYSLRAVTSALRSAAEDPNISAMFLYGAFMPQNYGSGFSALREFRNALLDFKESGKPIIAHVQSPTVRSYYVASAADRVLLDPYGMVGLNGLASQQFFIANALEKYGVGVQVTRAGRYKSAIEIFTEEKMSEASRAQTNELLDDAWRVVLEEIGSSRSLSVDELQELADSIGFVPPEPARTHGLVDEIAYMDQVLDELRELTGTPADTAFPQVDMGTYSTSVEAGRQDRARGAQIAVIYVEGDIIDGEGSFGSVGGDRFAREIRRLRQTGETQALVVRVNSPGGSVAASETIRREISLAREEMPVVVSFGSFAASGGYWVATDSDRIFSQPNTVTGSIGVFGILPNIQEIANRFGVTFDEVKTAKFADSLTITRPKTEEEMELIQGLVDDVYQDFLERVAGGRDMSVEEVSELAGGRVWSGADALHHGLVDEIGGLREAIAYAADRAELTEWSLYEFPRPADFEEILAEMMEPDRAPQLVRHPFEEFTRNLKADYRSLQMMNDPRGLYARLPFFLRIN